MVKFYASLIIHKKNEIFNGSNLATIYEISNNF